MGKTPKILTAGSITMDLIVETDIFPGSGETVLGREFFTAPGGKGANQAVQAARLGADVTMIGCVGNDEFGNALIASLKESNVNTSHVTKTDEASTAIANIILENQEGKGTKNRILVVPGANLKIKKEQLAFLETDIKNYDIVMLQLEIDMEINEYITDIAYKNGIPVMMNCAPAAPLPDEYLSKLSYISPNEHEAYRLTGVKINTNGSTVDENEVKSAANVLFEKGVANVIITLGSKGAVMVSKDEYIYLEPNKVDKVVDPTAAGDSFVGAFCYGKSGGMNNRDALSFANKTAAITVTKKGAQPSLPYMDEVNKKYGL